VRPEPEENFHKFKWLVGMSTRATEDLRVGCGEYHLAFSPQSGLATRLSIIVEHMLDCPFQHKREIMDWLQGQSYPWYEFTDMIDSVPPLAYLQLLLVYVAI
jgi:hypothetical protein